MLKRLIVQSIETGSITALVMILLLITYETMGTKNATYVVWQVSPFIPCYLADEHVRELSLGPL